MKSQQFLSSSLINQELRAAKLFLYLFYIIFIVYEIVYPYVASPYVYDWGKWLIYSLLFLLLLFSVYSIKMNKPQYVKYLIFIPYTLTVLILEIIAMEYYYSNIVEVLVVLFTPIFVNKRFYWIVLLGTSVKYLIEGFVFQSNNFIFPVTLITLFAIVSYIFLNRMLHYVNAIKDRYDEKLDDLTKDATYKAVTSGTTMLNHTIKNEVLKISMSINLIKSSSGELNPSISKYLQIINDSTDHMIDMVTRIHSQMQDVELNPQKNNVSTMIRSVLELNKLYIESKDISISNQLDRKLELLCDSTYIQEVFNNVVRNAIEAMKSGDRITIQSHTSPKYITVLIEDSGSGIPSKDLPYLFDPFFTTKDQIHNFGLGLAFCHNVMLKSRGSLQIQSEENIGTKVILNFPNF